MSEFLAELSLSRTFVQDYIDSLRCEKAIRLLHFVFECTLFECVPPFGEIVFPYNLERLNNLLFCPLLFVFLLKSFFYSVVKDQRPTLSRVGSLRLLGFVCFSLTPPMLAADTVGWSVWMDSNHRPRAYQARALAT